MFGLSLTKFILGAFVAYVLNSLYVFYTLFNPEECHGDLAKCIRPAYSLKDFSLIKVSIYTSRYSSAKYNDLDLLWDSVEDSVEKYHDVSVNITLPYSTRRNGSLYAYVFIHPMKENPMESKRKPDQIYTLTKFMVPRDKEFNLIQGNKENSSVLPITHMYSKLTVYVGIQVQSFPRYAIPSDIYHLLNFNNKGEYLPLVYVDGLSTLKRQLRPVQKDTQEMLLKIYITPVSLGRLRIWSSVEQTLGKMKELGFTENDLDDMKGLFSDTNLYFLGMTFLIAIVHLLFDVLAFKNDVSFWKGKESMEGMSTRTVIWRCVSTTIIFFYLLDEKTSLLVLVPSGVGAIIEFWKVTIALKITIDWSSRIPKLVFGAKSKSEQETAEFDEQAMKYLSYALYPLLLAASVYSLIYQPHKSWYSWVIRSLVNGVYAFGFLFMLPQLFVNYKLKSVAHLPWRAFMYKAFNTFIDDVFAFIIVMPMAHRVACFRDDLVFLVYLYQRWLYPVDKSRVNEYGMIFDEKETKESKKEK